MIKSDNDDQFSQQLNWKTTTIAAAPKKTFQYLSESSVECRTREFSCKITGTKTLNTKIEKETTTTTAATVNFCRKKIVCFTEPDFEFFFSHDRSSSF